MATSTINHLELNKECPVCYDNYTKKIRIRVVCEYDKCQYESCLSCIKNYIENITDDSAPNCMNCKNVYTDDFINNYFTKTFIKKIIKKEEEKKRKKIMDTIPEYMEMAENEKTIREYLEEIKNDKSVLFQYNKDYQYFNEKRNLKIISVLNLFSNHPDVIYDSWPDYEQFVILDKMSKKKLEQFCIDCNISTLNCPTSNRTKFIIHIILSLNDEEYIKIHLKYNFYKDLVYNQRVKIKCKNDKVKLLHDKISNTEIKKTLKTPCPNNDCRGFLSSENECPLCNSKVCETCMNVKEDEEHKCNNDDIQTVKLIKKNTKNCPNCNVSIHKTEGCDQMWCVKCHTTFSWNTLKIKNGEVIHNPEYIQYIKNEVKNLNNNKKENIFGECNTDIIPDAYFINNVISQPFMSVLGNYIVKIKKYIDYIQLYLDKIIKYEKKLVLNNTFNKVYYILGDFNENKLHKKLDDNVMIMKYLKEVKNLVEIELKIGIESLWAIVNSISTDRHIYCDFIEQVVHFSSYIDKEYIKLYENFNLNVIKKYNNAVGYKLDITRY